MAYMRRDVRGTTGQDIEKINSNFMDIFDKVFGNINFSDADTKLKNKILTQWIPIQGEGNLDSSNPLYIRFFVPPNTRTVVSTNFNVITEHYRMDSSITSTEESKQEVVSVASSVAPSQTKSSSISPETTKTSSIEPDQTITATSSASGVSGISNANVGISSVGGGGVTSYGGGGAVEYVRKWGSPGYEVDAPTDYIYPNNTSMINSNLGGFITSNDNRLTYGAVVPVGKMSNSVAPTYYVDLYSIQHSHNVPSHTHDVPAHSHSITLQPHTHSVKMEGHAHDVTIPSHSHDVTIPPHSHDLTIPSHTHEVTGSVTIPAHSHTLNEGIKISATSPSNVKFHINDNVFATLQGNNSANNIDITDKIKIGEWNTIKITSSTVARATLYGTLEIRIK